MISILLHLFGLVDSLSFSVAGECDPGLCFGSSFNSITAAWGSIGYYTLADLMRQMGAMDKIPILLYACSAIAALVGVAIGMPPRTYIWFFLGPAIFNFLVYTHEDVQGVNWEVGGFRKIKKLFGEMLK